MQSLHATIQGFVQGVSYRAFVKKQADMLRLTGIVANIKDGTVMVVAEGNEKSLKAFLKFLKKGSMFAKVCKVDYDFKKYSGKFTGFKVVREENYILDQINAYKNFTKAILKPKNIKNEKRHA